MQRQAAFRKLPTQTTWWKSYEPILVAAIGLRLTHGVRDNPQIDFKSKRKKRFEPLVVELILAADAAGERHAGDAGIQEAQG